MLDIAQTKNKLCKPGLYGHKMYAHMFLNQSPKPSQSYQMNWNMSIREIIGVSLLPKKLIRYQQIKTKTLKQDSTNLETKWMLSAEKFTFNTHDPCPESVPAKLACWLEQIKNN